MVVVVRLCAVMRFFTPFPPFPTVKVRSLKRERAMKGHFAYTWQLSLTYDADRDTYPVDDISLSILELTFAEVRVCVHVCVRMKKNGKRKDL